MSAATPEAPPIALCSRAFGLRLRFGERPPGPWNCHPTAGTGPTLEVRPATPAAIAASWSGAGEVGWEAMIDGTRFVVERGTAGDHRFLHGSRSTHHLSPDGSLLLRAASPELGPAGWRTCLDSVLFSASLVSGYEALHAAAVATERGAVCVTAAAGGGKSTLLAALLRDGCSMLADDVTTLEPGREGAPLAHPGPPLMTVPDEVAPLPGPEIARLGDERWVGVPVQGRALPLAALVVLARRPGSATAMRPVRNPLGELLGGLLRFPRTPARERARFEAAAAIADHVPIWRLEADTAVAPEALAAIVREAA